MYITQYEVGDVRDFTDEEREEYLDDDSRVRTSQVFFKEKLKPSNGWAVPFVTGHRYHAHWGIGLDFEQIYVTLSDRWTKDDKPIIFHTNYTDVREVFNITDTASGVQLENDLLPDTLISDTVIGDNY